MMPKRKYIRIAMSEDEYAKFLLAKELAEVSTSLSLSDSAFILSIVRQAIKRREWAAKVSDSIFGDNGHEPF